MKRSIVLAGLLPPCLSLALALAPAHAAEATAATYRPPEAAVKRSRPARYVKQLDAVFSSVDSTGCITDEVSIRLDSPVGFRPTGRKGDALLTVRRSDDCRGTELLTIRDGFRLRPDAFSLSDDLASGTLNFTAKSKERVSGETMPIDVTLAWTSTEDPIEGLAPDGETVSRAKRTRLARSVLRLAEAAGSVTVNGLDLTPEPSRDAAIQITER